VVEVAAFLPEQAAVVRASAAVTPTTANARVRRRAGPRLVACRTEPPRTGVMSALDPRLASGLG
jgi:hypothetical protein